MQRAHPLLAVVAAPVSLAVRGKHRLVHIDNRLGPSWLERESSSGN